MSLRITEPSAAILLRLPEMFDAMTSNVGRETGLGAELTLVREGFMPSMRAPFCAKRSVHTKRIESAAAAFFIMDVRGPGQV